MAKSASVSTTPFLQILVDYGPVCALQWKKTDFDYWRAMRKIGSNVSTTSNESKVKESDVNTNKEDNENLKYDIKDDGRETGISVVKMGDHVTVLDDSNINLNMFTDDMIEENFAEAKKSIKGNNRTIELTILTVLYSAMMITPDQLFNRINRDPKKYLDEAELVNSISKFFSGSTIIPNVTGFSVNEVINLSLLKDILTFESNHYSNINSGVTNIDIDEMLEKVRDLMIEANRVNVKMEGVKDSDPVTPLIFVNKNLANVEAATVHRVPKNILNKLEKDFKELLEGYNYQFNRINDMIELVINKPDIIVGYLIDPGTIIGNGFNMICNIPNDTIMVNIKHKDIISKMLENHMYVLTPEEIQRVSQDMFMNQKIYSMIDMSKGSEILPKLSQEDFDKLGKKLTFITNLDWDTGAINTKPRLRFRSFKSVDDFVLVSDDKCKSPLPPSTITTIVPGLTIKVNGDNVNVKCGEMEEKFTIEKYGDL